MPGHSTTISGVGGCYLICIAEGPRPNGSKNANVTLRSCRWKMLHASQCDALYSITPTQIPPFTRRGTRLVRPYLTLCSTFENDYLTIDHSKRFFQNVLVEVNRFGDASIVTRTHLQSTHQGSFPTTSSSDKFFSADLYYYIPDRDVRSARQGRINKAPQTCAQRSKTLRAFGRCLAAVGGGVPVSVLRGQRRRHDDSRPCMLTAQLRDCRSMR